MTINFEGWSLQTFQDEWLDELADLWVDAWQHTLPQIDFYARFGWFKEHLRELHDAGAQTACAMAIARPRLVGFFTLNRSTRYLDQLAVASDRFGSGVASDLLNLARHLSPHHLELHVNQDNYRALRFYEREGFCRGSAAVNPLSGLKTWQMIWDESR
jgi:putative acetyltransferase